MSGGHTGGGGGGGSRSDKRMNQSMNLTDDTIAETSKRAKRNVGDVTLKVDENEDMTVDEPNVDKRVCLRETEERAIVMQRFHTHKLATDGDRFGMTSAVAKAIPFADLVYRLREPDLVKVMKRILHRVCVLTAEGVRTCPGSEETENVNVRVFLVSFIAAYHPTKVFGSMNNLETGLMTASVAMLQVFDELCLAIISSERGADLKEPIKKALNFPAVLHAYLKAFQAWKVPDEAKSAARITNAFTALSHSRRMRYM
jgi:hypothetical protein